MTEFLTIKEIAKQLQVPESNIRYYRDRFEDYIPSVGEGRRRRYKQEALQVFGHIVQSYRDEKNTDQIASELASNFPRAVHVDNGPQKEGSASGVVPADKQQFSEYSVQGVLETQARTLEYLAQALNQSSSLSSEVTRLSQDHQRVKKCLIQLWRQQGANKVATDNEDLQNLCKQVQFLEERMSALEDSLRQELHGLRCELKECLNVTRELVQTIGDGFSFSRSDEQE